MLVCLLLLCQPVWAQTGSTALTATVPEQPEEEIEAAAGAEILDDIPLPEGWEWEDGSISLKPGESVTGTAVYRDKDGTILAEREIIVEAPDTASTEKQTAGGGQSTGVKTGDETDFVSWIVIMLLSLVVLFAAGIRGQRKAKQQ